MIIINIFIWAVFVASSAAYIAGRRADYRNSLGRIELNPTYTKPDGYFDGEKYRKNSILFFVCIVLIFGVVGILTFPFVTLFASFVMAIFGHEAWTLSKIK